MKINNNKNQQQGEKRNALSADNDLNKKRVKHTIVATN